MVRIHAARCRWSHIPTGGTDDGKVDRVFTFRMTVTDSCLMPERFQKWIRTVVLTVRELPWGPSQCRLGLMALCVSFGMLDHEVLGRLWNAPTAKGQANMAAQPKTGTRLSTALLATLPLPWERRQ